MPLETIAINSFDAPIMRETTHDDELRERIANLYTSNDTFNHGMDSATLMTVFQSAFSRGGLLYVGMFNDKPIVAMGCFDDEQTDTKRLQYLAVHPQNKNRGVEAKFIKQVYDQEVLKGVRRFMPADEDIHQIMSEYEMLEVKRY